MKCVTACCASRTPIGSPAGNELFFDFESPRSQHNLSRMNLRPVPHQNPGRVATVEFSCVVVRHFLAMMLTFLRLFSLIPTALKIRSELALENLALRHYAEFRTMPSKDRLDCLTRRVNWVQAMCRAALSRHSYLPKSPGYSPILEAVGQVKVRAVR